MTIPFFFQRVPHGQKFSVLIILKHHLAIILNSAVEVDAELQGVAVKKLQACADLLISKLSTVCIFLSAKKL